jgi:hypothetical protein
MPDQITLINPETGETVSVDADRAEEAIKVFGYVPESQEAGVQRQIETEMERAYGDQELLGAIEGVLSGATFGVSDVFLPKLPGVTKEGVRERKKRTTGRLVGELGTEIGLALAAGGAGLGARLARLTPPGALARSTALYVAKGGGKVGRHVAAGIAGGLYGAGASTMSDIALSDEPIAIDALVSRVLLSAAVGGAVGGAAGVATKYGPRLAKRLGERVDKTEYKVEKWTRDHLQKLAKHGSPAAKPLKYENFLPASRQTKKAAGEELSTLLLTVDDAGARGQAAAQDLRRMVGDGGLFRLLPDEEAGAFRVELGGAIEQHRQALNSTRRWTRKVLKGVDLEKIKAGKAALPEEQAAEAVEVLAQLDDATSTLDQAMERVRQRFQEVAPEQFVPEMPSRWREWGRKLADVGAVIEALEVAGVENLPDVDRVPVIGPILGAYLKYRAVANVLRKGTSSFKSTPKALVASRAVTLRNKLEEVAEQVAARSQKVVPAVEKLGRYEAVKLLDKSAETAEEAIEKARDLTQVRDQALFEMPNIPEELRERAADRVVAIAQYMAQNAPKAPFTGSAWTPKAWRPSLVEAIRWQEIVDSRNDPGSVLRSLAEGAARPVAAQAVRDMFPDLWQAQRQSLLERLERIAAVMSRQRRLNLGASFDMPFDPSQFPGYRMGGTEAKPPEQAQGAEFKAGPLPTKSSSAMLSMTMDEKRLQR